MIRPYVYTCIVILLLLCIVSCVNLVALIDLYVVISLLVMCTLLFVVLSHLDIHWFRVVVAGVGRNCGQSDQRKPQRTQMQERISAGWLSAHRGPGREGVHRCLTTEKVYDNIL